MSGPLAGYRILDFGRFQLGPLSATWLADLGASVIKVEARTGDPVRSPHPRSVPIVLAHNRGKRSIAIDFRLPEGRAAVLKLAESADVVMHNFRNGVMERMGLGYEDFRAVNPRIVMAAASAFGPKGPRKYDPGNDTIGQASGGLAFATGVTGGDPIVAGAAISDSIGAYALVAGVLAALLERERSGEGQYVETSLYGTQIALQSWEIGWHSMSGEMPIRNGAYPYLAGWGIFGTADSAVAVGGIGDIQWPKFCALVGQDEYAERWPSALERGANQEAVADVIRTALRQRDNAYWLKELAALDIVVAAVQSYADILEDPQARENGYILDLEFHGGNGVHPGAGNPWSFGRTPVEPGRRAPELGEHTEEILLEAGYQWEAIAALQAAGVVGFEM